MKKEYIDIYIIDCLGLEAGELQERDLTATQLIECKEYNNLI